MKKHNHEPISNAIFETYRIQERVKEQVQAIKLLVNQGYTILDLEGNIIRKDTINLENKPSYEYERARKTATDKS